MTRTEALQLITLLQMAYPRQDLGDKTVEVYAGFIQDLDYNVAERAIKNHIRGEKWFPSIAEIREACVELVHDLPSTEEAMEIIRSAVQNYNYQAIKNNDLLRQAVATVGFEKIGYSEYPEPLYRQVKEAYENLRKREIKNLQSTPAVGMLASEERLALIKGDLA
jgi:hypothetical protein